ncbi:MAG TPA: hypothetical protein VFA00_06075 [Actinomycetota bacterium]|nr:hypothetical protein [Actinomycetota bacterium]
MPATQIFQLVIAAGFAGLAVWLFRNPIGNGVRARADGLTRWTAGAFAVPNSGKVLRRSRIFHGIPNVASLAVVQPLLLVSLVAHGIVTVKSRRLAA